MDYWEKYLERKHAQEEWKHDQDRERLREELNEEGICDLLEYYPEKELEKLKQEVIDEIITNRWRTE